MYRVLVREATCAIVRHEAEEISPMMQATLSRSIKRSALVEAVCGLTESSFKSSTLRPIMPPAAFISLVLPRGLRLFFRQAHRFVSLAVIFDQSQGCKSPGRCRGGSACEAKVLWL